MRCWDVNRGHPDGDGSAVKASGRVGVEELQSCVLAGTNEFVTSGRWWWDVPCALLHIQSRLLLPHVLYLFHSSQLLSTRNQAVEWVERGTTQGKFPINPKDHYQLPEPGGRAVLGSQQELNPCY